MTNKRPPKTHSEILWHFTGGPKWNRKRNTQNKRNKRHEEALEILIKILESRTLQVGNYREVVKVKLPDLRVVNKKSGEIEICPRPDKTIATKAVCCVAEIHETELFHHALRYGKCGIGFKREALIRSGFNPVLYTLRDEDLVQKYFRAIAELETFCEAQENEVFGNLDTMVEEANDIISDMSRDDFSREIQGADVEYPIKELFRSAYNAQEALQNLLAFLKTFDRSEFDSIYAEREWRSVKPFSFDWSHVAKIVAPENGACLSKLKAY
jgi:hypothetical protein